MARVRAAMGDTHGYGEAVVLISELEGMLGSAIRTALADGVIESSAWRTGSITRWATSFGNTSSMPTTRRSGRVPGRWSSASIRSRASDNLDRVTVDHAPDLGWHEAAPGLDQQFLAEPLLEPTTS